MLFLLPPSETKATGTYPGVIESKKPLKLSGLAFKPLTDARQQLISQLIALSGNPAQAQKVLGLSAKQLDDIQRNAELSISATMPAINRYTGTLFDAVHGRGLKGTANEFAHLDGAAMARAADSVLIQSPLFGLIRATDSIPYYRFSATTRLPGLSLKQHWQTAHEGLLSELLGPVLDMRSKSYAEFAPLPDRVEGFTLDVLLVDAAGNRTTMNHFSKKSKGQLLHAALTALKAPQTIKDLAVLAKRIGFNLEISDRALTLLVPAA
jgi:uncharacterized protein